MQIQIRQFSYCVRRTSSAATIYSKRRVLRKIGLRRNQPLNFPIPRVLDDFTKLVRLNFERLKDADPELCGTGWIPPQDEEYHAEKGQGRATPKETHKTTDTQETDQPLIRYFPSIERSVDSKLTFDPATKNVTFAKSKIDQDLDSILQTFRDLQSEPPAATLPTSLIRLVRSPSRNPRASTHRPAPMTSLQHTPFVNRRTYATLNKERITVHEKMESATLSGYRLRGRKDRGRHSSLPSYTLRRVSSKVVPRSTNHSESFGVENLFDKHKIRKHLENWAATHGDDDPIGSMRGKIPSPGVQYAQNVITQSGEDDLTSSEPGIESHDGDDDLSAEDTLDLDSTDGISGFFVGEDYFKRGDLVQIQSAQSVLGIFMKNLEDRKCLIYSETGRWLISDLSTPLFSVSQFVPPQDVRDLLPYLPSLNRVDTYEAMRPILDQAPPRHVGKVVREYISRLRNTAAELYRKHADRLDQCYHLLANENVESGVKSIDLETATSILFQLQNNDEASPEMRFLVHETLFNEPNVVPMLHRHRLNPLFYVIPKSVLQDLLTVQKWVREHQEITIQSSVPLSDGKHPHASRAKTTRITSFAAKARRLVAESRSNKRTASDRFKTHEFLEDYKKDSQEAVEHQFSESDLLIIEYLKSWTVSSIIKVRSPMSSVGPAILRAIGTYDGLPLDQETGFTLLQEMNVLPSWENGAASSIHHGIPGYHAMSVANRLQTEVAEEVVTYRLQDSMATFRRDWGHLPVYCIDSATAKEIDDGLSIESVSGSTDVWVHVHVANPTSFIKPDTAMANFANYMTRAVYLPERKVAMLPPSLVQEHLSLGQGRPCITFSARIDKQGVVQEDEISHGIIHNVFFITPEEVDDVLGRGAADTTEQNPVFLIGNAQLQSEEAQTKSLKPQRALDAVNVQDLRHLQALASVAGATWSPIFRGADEAIRDVETAVRFAESQPTLEVQDVVHDHDSQDCLISMSPMKIARYAADQMVAHFMVLAGKICGSWCANRDIPVPYRGFLYNPQPPIALKLEGKDMAAYLKNANNAEDLLSRSKQIRELGFTTWTASPAPHHLINAPAYAQTTSPLRRYGDMITHWQIEAALRRGMKPGVYPSQSAAELQLPFSHEKVQNVSQNFISRNFQLRKLEKKSQRHWFVLAIHRAYYSEPSKLPPTLLVKLTKLVNNPLNLLIKGQLLDFGEDVRIDCGQKGLGIDSEYRLNDIWEVRISSITVYFRRIEVKPIRLVAREHNDMVSTSD